MVSFAQQHQQGDLIGIISRLIEEAKSFAGQNPQCSCPRCGKSLPGFCLHDQRRRQLRVIVNSFVRVFVVVLSRWKCVSCERTFTHYPYFVQPYKRYFVEDILRLSGNYLEDPGATYRQVTSEEGMPIGYQAVGADIDERQLSHSTAWRWLSWLGELTKLLELGLRLLREKDTDFDLHRHPVAILPWKYRSNQRKELLQRAGQLLLMSKKFVSVFTRNIFPTYCNSPPLLSV